MAEALLSADDIDVWYQTGAHALRGVSLEVNEGERVAIVGANGAGKTTFARVVCGASKLHRAKIRRGTVRLCGRTITRATPWHVLRLGISTVPEGRGIIPDLSVEDNLKLVLAGLPARSRGRLEEAYGGYPVLGERRRSMAGLLSGGEQQMLAIARALLGRPRLLVADELSLGLAPRIVADLMAGLHRRSVEDGIAVLLIEQGALAALRFADKAYAFEQGQVAEFGSTAELLAEGVLRDRYLGASET